MKLIEMKGQKDIVAVYDHENNRRTLWSDKDELLEGNLFLEGWGRNPETVEEWLICFEYASSPDTAWRDAGDLKEGIDYNVLLSGR